MRHAGPAANQCKEPFHCNTALTAYKLTCVSLYLTSNRQSAHTYMQPACMDLQLIVSHAHANTEYINIDRKTTM
jgi:hypothetical protein